MKPLTAARSAEPEDSAFDLRARAELALALAATDAPPQLYRKTPPLMARRSFQRAVLGLLLVGSGSGTVLAMRPPELEIGRAHV